MKGAAADILKETQRVLDVLAKDELNAEDKEWVHKTTLSGYENHINPGILEYRKAVSTDYTSIEWSDNANGFTDINGKKYIDFLGGFGIYNVGHRHPKVIQAVQNQMKRQALHSQELLEPFRAMLAKLIADITPGDLQYSFFGNSGTEAVEGAMKLAMLHTGRKSFVAAVGAFHGKTLGALSATARAKFRQPFLPILPDCYHVPYADADFIESALKSADTVGNDIAAVILEPIQGEGGINVPPDDYIPRVRDLCDRYGALLIIDEVQTGMGRTGKMFAVDHWNVVPDIMCLGKALGGKAPFVVFEDADLDAALNGAVVASFVNTGQDCTAATRIYVHESVYKKFLGSFVDLVAKLRVGDPSSPKTDMGSLVSADQLGRVEGFMKRHTQGKVLCGGKRPKGLSKGFFFEPTVVADVPQKAELMQREVFGPVVCVAPFKDEGDAVTKANDVPYGLAGSVWTSNIQRAIRVSAAMRLGTVWINDHLPLASEMPHGGFKQSGFGKDLSAYALEEYTTVKHVMADTTGVARKPWHYTAFGDA